jgi:ankyrin repeat protein
LDVILSNIIFNNNISLFEFLLDKKTDINEVNSNGYALFHLVLFDKKNDSSLFVNRLISRHANVNVLDKTGNTPLHIAFWNGSQYMPAIVKMMLNHGANPNIANKHGKNVADFAINYAKEEIYYIYMLVLLINNKYPGCELDKSIQILLLRKYKSIEKKLNDEGKIVGA